MNQRYSVLVVEDDDVTRQRFVQIIEAHANLRLDAAIACLDNARSRLDESVPDVLLTDLGLPDGNGIDLIREIRSRGFDTEIMVITVFGDEKHVIDAIEAGATGYLLKDGDPQYIVGSIFEMLAGGSPISPAIARHLLKRFQPLKTPIEQVAALPKLTPREQDVLTHLAKGFTASEIATVLSMSAHTVNSHVKHIYRKLEVRSRAEAVYEAVQLGLINLAQ